MKLLQSPVYIIQPCTSCSVVQSHTRSASDLFVYGLVYLKCLQNPPNSAGSLTCVCDRSAWVYTKMTSVHNLISPGKDLGRVCTDA